MRSRGGLGAWMTVVSLGAGCGSIASGGVGGGGSIGMFVASVDVMIAGIVPVTVSPATRIAPIAAWTPITAAIPAGEGRVLWSI